MFKMVHGRLYNEKKQKVAVGDHYVLKRDEWFDFYNEFKNHERVRLRLIRYCTEILLKVEDFIGQDVIHEDGTKSYDSIMVTKEYCIPTEEGFDWSEYLEKENITNEYKIALEIKEWFDKKWEGKPKDIDSFKISDPITDDFIGIEYGYY